jgi:hypothetical protein
VPEGVSGCYVPVSVVTGSTVSNYTSISVAPNGGTCSDPVSGLTSEQINAIANGGTLRIGTISLFRTATKLSVLGQTFDSTTDSGSAAFLQYDYNRLIRSSTGAGTFTIGSCLVATYRGQTAPTDVAQPEYLDAGEAINVNGPKGAKQLRRVQGFTGIYSAQLGGGTAIPIPGAPAPEPLYLDPGQYTFTGSGGTRVGAFNANMTLTPLIQWDNMASVETVTRSNGQLITWSGGDPNSYVYIAGSSIAGPQLDPVVASFTCYERASAGRFTIPSAVLLAIPPTPSSALIPGTLSVGNFGTPATFNASGLDVGLISAGSITSKTVTFR